MLKPFEKPIYVTRPFLPTIEEFCRRPAEIWDKMVNQYGCAFWSYHFFSIIRRVSFLIRKHSYGTSRFFCQLFFSRPYLSKKAKDFPRIESITEYTIL